MSKSSHSLQREPGLQSPLRPITGVISLEDAFTFSTTTGNWTTADQIMNVAVDTVFFDDKSRVSVDANDDINLPPGVWEFILHPIAVNGTAGDATVEVAVTNAGGTTVHGESGVVTLNQNQDSQILCVAQFHLTANSVVQIRGRSADTVTAADEGIVGYFRKIGNANET